MADARLTMYVIAGPNGAGKSTLYKTQIAGITPARFINADEIQKTFRENEGDDDPYAAAKEASRLRKAHLEQGRSFVTETVFSHSSKLELIREAKARGFEVILYHVHLSRADVSVARVHRRVNHGGHDVPEHKIRERFERNQALIAKAAQLADSALVFDSSAYGAPPRWVLTIEFGAVVEIAEEVPDWVTRLYRSDAI